MVGFNEDVVVMERRNCGLVPEVVLEVVLEAMGLGRDVITCTRIDLPLFDKFARQMVKS